ncbi:MAG: hypothetical protein KBC33_00100 [Candidatus Pacebacteria bacterium]|nr:hypothetical protein [Candidatus Paceibacterota bacterium]
MNTSPIQKIITLESIAESIKGLATIESVNNAIKGLATREDLKMEVNGLQHQITNLQTDITIQAIDAKKRIDGLTMSIDDLPTRSELNNLEQRLEIRISGVEKNLEGQIDDLAISVKRGFDEVHGELKRVYVRLDEMDEHLVTIEEESKIRFTAIQNQLDNIQGLYPNRSEHSFLEKRVKRIEKVVFA